VSVINFSKVAISASVAALFLSACSSTSSSTDTSGVLSAASVNDRMTGADTQILKIIGDGTADNPGIPGTGFSRIPTEGTATYRGISAVVISNGEDMVLDAVGISNVNIDFGAADDESVVTGNLRNMRAFNAAGEAERVIGELLLSGGNIGKDFDDAPETARQNSLFADYAGNLTAFGQTFGISGELEGKLRGTRTNENARSVVRAVDLADTDVAVTAGQTGLTADIMVAADNDIVPLVGN
jgi:hypothetical protein